VKAVLEDYKWAHNLSNFFDK